MSYKSGEEWVGEFFAAIANQNYSEAFRLFMPREKKANIRVADKNTLIIKIDGNKIFEFREFEQTVDFFLLDKDGLSIFMHSVKNGQAQMMCDLIDIGVDINQVDKNGRTAVELALEKKSRGLLDDLIGSGAETDAILSKAIEDEKYEAAGLLIASGAKIDAAYKDLLHMIARTIDDRFVMQEVARAWVNAGFDVNVRDENYRSAMDYAIERENLDVIQGLLDLRARIDIKGFLKKFLNVDEVVIPPLQKFAENNNHQTDELNIEMREYYIPAVEKKDNDNCNDSMESYEIIAPVENVATAENVATDASVKSVGGGGWFGGVFGGVFG